MSTEVISAYLDNLKKEAPPIPGKTEVEEFLNSRVGKRVMWIIDKRIEMCVKSLKKCEQVALYRAQGAANELDAIMAALLTATNPEEKTDA